MEKYTLFILKNRKVILSFWLILIFIALANIIFSHSSFESGIGSIENSISQSVDNKLKTEFSENLSGNLIITFSAEKYSLDSIKYKNALSDLERMLLKQKEIKKTFSILSSNLPNLVSKDKKVTVILLETNNHDFSFSESYTQNLRLILKIFAKKYSDIKPQIYVTGNAAFSYDMNKLSESQGRDAELRVLVITFLVLIFAFSSITSSLIAVFAGISATVFTLSLLKLFAGYFTLSIFCQNVSTMLGLGLSIDYSLLMITRYRQELLISEKSAALIKTIQTAGVSVFYSGITVLIGFIALFIPNLSITTSIALGGTMVVLFSILIALTFTALALFTFSDKLDYPKFLSNSLSFKNKFNFKWARFIIKNSIPATIIALVILTIFSLPALNIKLSDPEIRTMPDSMESKQGFKELQNVANGDTMFPVFILAKSRQGNITDVANLINISNYLNKLREDKRVSDINSILSFKEGFNLTDYFTLYNSGIQIEQLENIKKYLINRDNTLTLIQVFPAKSLKSFEINKLISDLRLITTDNLNIEVGGPASVSHDLIEKLYSSYPYIILCIYMVTFILLAYAFKSLLIPFKAIFLNTISLFASYGILVMIFQYNWGAWLINLKYSPESLLSGIPIILFCIMFSLSMDYEVFLLSRIHESYLENNNNEEAIITGLSETSGLITKAAMVMIIVFGAFTQADIIIIKMLGTGLAIAIFIDTTLIRMILVPGFMKLAGKWNWYLPFNNK